MQISYKKISWTVYILGWQKYASYIVCACIKMKTLIQALLTKSPLADLQPEITILCSGFRVGFKTLYDNGTFSAPCRLYINTLIHFWNKDLKINMVLFIIILLFNFSCQFFFSTCNGNQSKLCTAQAKPTLQRLLTDYFKTLTNLQGDHWLNCHRLLTFLHSFHWSQHYFHCYLQLKTNHRKKNKMPKG